MQVVGAVVTSVIKVVFFFATVCWSVCWFPFEQDYSKNHTTNFHKFFGHGGPRRDEILSLDPGIFVLHLKFQNMALPVGNIYINI